MVSWSSCCRSAALAVGLTLAVGAVARGFDPATAPERPVSIRADAEPKALQPGHHGKIEVKIAIADGYHVQAHDVGESFYVPTTITWTAPRGIRLGTTVFPEAKLQTVSFDDKPVPLYEKRIEVKTPVRALKSMRPGRYVVRGRLRYQACNDTACLPPATVPFTVVIRVKG